MSLASDKEELAKLVNYDKRWLVMHDEEGAAWVHIKQTVLDAYEAVELAHWIMQTFGNFEPVQSQWNRNQELKAPNSPPTRLDKLKARIREWLK